MPRKKRAPEAQPTDAALEADATAAHDAELAKNPVSHPLPAADPVPLYPSTPPELLDDHSTAPAMPREEAVAARDEVAHALKHQEHPTDDHPTPDGTKHARREQARRADPFRLHSVYFPDGYRISVQESDSRRTMEIQFGDGSKTAQPKNFGPIKDALRNAGMHWNGECAWVIDLVPERGSFHQREEAKARNKAIRTKIEEQVLPTVVGLEELARGPVELSQNYRQRIEGTMR